MTGSGTTGDGVSSRRSETGDGAPDVVVVGAGVAGLSCAAELARSGLRVTVVEARGRIGGRVHTVRPPGAPLPVELGAEFVHGTPPELLAVIRAAGLAAVPALDEPWRAADDGLRPAPWGEDASDRVFGSLDGDRTPDRTVDDFLADWTRRNPGGAAGAARAREYVSGFHAADPALMGERALAHEMAATEAEGGERSLRLPSGYDRVVDWLRASAGPGVTVRLRTTVTALRWRPGEVSVETRPAGDGEGATPDTLTVPRVVLTLPIGVLRARTGEGGLRPDPMPASHERALERLYMGHARRVVMHFERRLWTSPDLRSPGVTGSLDAMGFLFAPRAAVPVWWTAAPMAEPVITGWLGGGRAARLTGMADEQVIRMALESLAATLRLPREGVAAALRGAFTHDWGADRWALGAYSYAGLDGTDARRALAQPVDDTLFWAGEATHWTGSAGTVHGALASGRRAAAELLRSVER